jgi:uncharacterized protein YciW
MTETVKQLTVQDMIRAAMDQSPSNFDDAYQSVLADKIADAIDAKKAEVAQNYFEPQQVNTEVEDQDENTETDSRSDETSTSDEG